ncbi:MAG: tetratricopeptide repeat protein [Phycisphaerae bacterium]|jgi:serine/threonine-protein kinase
MMSDTPAAQLMVLMFTDVVGSVELKSRHGTAVYRELIARHDAISRQIIAGRRDARILNDTGDGFLAGFATAEDAVSAALLFQHALATEPWRPVPLQVRIGLHIGQVSLLSAEAGTQPKVVGLAADMAARVMDLALPGQILLTRGAFDDARQYIRHHPAGDEPDLRLAWMAHGRYLFQGNDEALEVFEVGVAGRAPLVAPPDSKKARAVRAVTKNEEDVLGWRPGRGLELPVRPGWVLERKLGEGGFGEVWLGRNQQTGEPRAFKFCFDPQGLRSLKRELTLFRLIREQLGDRRDIAKLYEVQLKEAPYFLECEYTAHGSLPDWADCQGGLSTVPLAQRLELVALVAEAVAAAHSLGVLHKDIKPSNVLIYDADDGTPRPRLADFGIGELTDRSKLDSANIPRVGFTATLVENYSRTTAGTGMYIPPELHAGKPFTIQGDIYALGIVLFQMVVGDLKRPLAEGWHRQVSDELLVEDIAACVDGDPTQRLASAAQVADRLRRLEERRAERQLAADTARRETRRRQVARFGVIASVALALLLGLAGVSILHERSLRQRALDAERLAQNEAQRAQATYQFLERLFTSINPAEARGRQYTVLTVLEAAAGQIDRSFPDQPTVRAALHETIGKTFQQLGEFDSALGQLRSALGIRRQTDGGSPADLADAVVLLGGLYHEMGDFAAAEPLYREALALAEEQAPDNTALRTRRMSALTVLLIDKGNLDEAETVAQDTLDLARRVFGERHLTVSSCLTNYATVRQARGDFDTAERLLTKALEMRRALYGPDNELVVSSLNNLAWMLYTKGDTERAGRVFEEGLDVARRILPPGHRFIADLDSGRSACLVAAGRYAEAEPVLARSYERLAILLGEQNHRTRQTAQFLVDLYEKWGKPEQATEWRERLAASRKTF